MLPYKQKSQINRLRYIRMTLFILWGGIFLLGVASALFLPTLQTINSRYTLAQSQTTLLEQGGSIVKTSDIKDLEKRSRTIKDKLATAIPTSPTRYVEKIRADQTNGITMNGYLMNNGDMPVVQIQGVALTRENLQTFIAALQADQGVVSVDSPVTNFVKSSQSQFTLTITFKPA